MILEFSLGNYRSFNEIQTLNFRAAGLKSEDANVDKNNIVEVGGQRVLKTIGIYGANASGKSNLLSGFLFMKRMIADSLNRFSTIGNAFRLSSTTQTNAGYFQVVMLLENKKYRYGFTLDTKGISSEWLFGPAEKNETFYFTRNQKEININVEYFNEGDELPYKTKLREDTLFLTFSASYNGEISNKIRDFFDEKVTSLQMENPGIDAFNNYATNYLVENGQKHIVMQWLRSAGLNFQKVEIENMGETERYVGDGNFIGGYDEGTVKLYKNSYNDNGKIVASIAMDLYGDESEGTQKYYSFIGKLYDKFENGGLFVSDEIDSNFHPFLLKKIISLFNDPLVNKANAQLLFTSHDTNLMHPDIMRRDQFYFTEKSQKDATVLYALSDLKGIRNNADFARQYLSGFYGAVPVLGSFIEEESSLNNPEAKK